MSAKTNNVLVTIAAIGLVLVVASGVVQSFRDEGGELAPAVAVIGGLSIALAWDRAWRDE